MLIALLFVAYAFTSAGISFAIDYGVRGKKVKDLRLSEPGSVDYLYENRRRRLAGSVGSLCSNHRVLFCHGVVSAE